MGEFFKGWRRKVGLVTLAMACVLMVGWVRSYVMCDAFAIKAGGDETLIVHSSSGGLCLRYEKTVWENGVHFWSWKSIDPDELPYVWGFGSYWLFSSYPGIVVPLTLLSAWLILAKPRKAKAATGSTP